MNKKKPIKKGLSDAELIEKYEAKKPASFNRALKYMLTMASTASTDKKSKQTEQN